MSTVTPKTPLSPISATRRKTARKAPPDASAPPKIARHQTSSTEFDGDTCALFDRIYAKHAPRLRAYVTRMLRDPHQAEDVVQETMLRAWRHAEVLVSISASGSPYAWLRRVAHNIAVDKVRAQKTRPVEVDENTACPWLLDDHASAVVESVFVARALARLNPAHREILRAVYFADRTAAQAAKVLGIPVGTVKSRTYHALRRLKVCLEEEMSGSAALGDTPSDDSRMRASSRPPAA